jgi:hypothetical protein
MLLIKIFHRHRPRYIATTQETSITKNTDLLAETGFETYLEEERLEFGVWGLGFVVFGFWSLVFGLGEVGGLGFEV